MDIVAKVLEKAAKEAEKYKPITVNKPLDIECDLGSLITVDKNDLDHKKLREQNESYLKELARDNTQLIINKLWELPTEKYEEVYVVKLPPPTFVLPREKRIPKPKPLTKWQEYAKEKGIKKKKDKVVWDDVVQKWVPNYGYKRAAVQRDKDWVLEVPQNADPYEDQFTKRVEEKKERVAKNELKRLRNLARSKNIKVPNVGLLPVENPSANQLNVASHLAKTSTASLGKFQPRLPKEKTDAKPPASLTKKRKGDSQIYNPGMEKKAHISIVDNILNKKPRLDVEKAVNSELYNQDQERAEEKKTQKKGGKKRTMFTQSKRKGGNKFMGEAGKKKSSFGAPAGRKVKANKGGPKAGKGQRIHKPKGRKRR